MGDDQLDFFDMLEAQAIPIVAEPDAVWMPNVREQPPKVYGDEYLARGIARWSVYCFLWLSDAGAVCAPRFGDSQDVCWVPRWVDLEQAERMLRDGYYELSGMHTGYRPGTTRKAIAKVYRYPSEKQRDRIKKALTSAPAHRDIHDLIRHLGLNGVEKERMFMELYELRKRAEAIHNYQQHRTDV